MSRAVGSCRAAEGALQWERQPAAGRRACFGSLRVQCGCGVKVVSVDVWISEEEAALAQVDAARVAEVELSRRLFQAALERCPACGLARSLPVL